MTAGQRCPADHKHGLTGTCYRAHGCRCDPCREFTAAARRKRRRQLAYGTWQPRCHDLRPVAEHIAMLQSDGFTRHAIAALAGVDNDSLRVESKAYLWQSVADAILAVTLEQMYAVDDHWVSARGSQRRLHAMGTLGWSLVYLAGRIGTTRNNLSSIFDNQWVTAQRHHAIAALYEELWNTRAPRTTNRERAVYTLVTRTAAKHGWLPPLAWDDIDRDPEPQRGASTDPVADVDPVAVELAVRGIETRLTPAERRAAVRELHGYKLGDREIAERLHCAQETVQRIRAELGLPAVLGADRLLIAS